MTSRRTVIQWIEDEPVRFFAAVQGTVAAAVLTVHWLTDLVIPTEVQAVWLVAVAAWLEFVTRQNVRPA